MTAEDAGSLRALPVARRLRKLWISSRPFGDSSLRDWLVRQKMREERALTGFHLLPLGLMLGIAAAYLVDPRLSPLPPLLLAAVLAVTALALRSRPLTHRLVLLLAATGAGAALATFEISSTRTTVLSGSAITRVEGVVEWRETDERGRSRYLVRIEATRQPLLSRPPERARILVAARHPPIAIGERFAALVRLSPPSGPALPGAYDFAFAPFFDGIGAIGFALGRPEPPPRLDVSARGLRERLAALRLDLAERIRSSIGGAEGAVAAALVTGVRAGIPDSVEEDLRTTGLAHVLSISGYHMALVAGFVMVGLRAILAALPGLVLNWPVKKIAAAAALLAASLYLALAGDNVATDRSFIMLAVMLGAVVLDRPALTLRNVSLAAILVLVMQPHALFSASFQMSFAATIALVGIFGAYARHRSTNQDKDGRSIFSLGGILRAAFALGIASLVAGLATAPFGAYHFGRIAPFGIVANLLLMPFFSLWIMPAAFIAMLLMPLGLDGLVWPLVGWGLQLVFLAADALASQLPDVASGRIGVVAMLLLAAAVLCASVLASAFRWLAVPLTLLGLAAAWAPREPPDLLIYEDGKQVAIVGADGSLSHLAARPSRFVDEQWRRMLGSPTEMRALSSFVCVDEICRATTRSGISVAWTENYEKTGDVCDSAEIAIVSRAIRETRCRSGAVLVTLRTLRRSGSLAVQTGSNGTVQVRQSVSWSADGPEEPWNDHRDQPWPERWIRPESGAATPSAPPVPVPVSSGGSIRPASPGP